MVDYDLGKVVGDKGDTGNGIASIELLSTSGKVKTYRITFTDGDHFDYQVSDGADGSSGIADIVTSWSATLSDTKVPSEKLAKNSLDAKLDNAISSTAVTIASNDNILITDYSDSNNVKRVSSILASQMKDSNAHTNIGSSANASQSTINTNIDTALSGKANSSSLSTVATTGSYNDLTNKPTIPSISGLEETANKVTSWSTTTTDAHYPSEKLVKTSLDAKANSSSLSTVATSGSYSDLSNKPSIPSSSSDLSDGSSLVKTSSTTGLLKNDGSVDTNSYLTTSSASSTYQTKLVSGTSIKTINNESLLASGNISVGGGSSVDIVTAWESTPSDSKVASEKLTKDTLDTKIAKSSTSGLVKNDGTIDTSAYITSSAITGMLTTSDVVDNLTSTSSTAPLSAKQGKALNDLIGQAITYINQ